ncbi:MAG: hypothetical protein ABJZ55_02165 [Fuerstiella sp.]
MKYRFAILEHDHPFLHWDLLLDVSEDQKLRTWRLLSSPVLETWIAAEPLPDHRRVYLDYEGEISGNRGSVKRIACGWYQEVSNLTEGERHFTITHCNLYEHAIHRLQPDGSPEWRFE